MFYANEHEPIHIHVAKGKGKITEKAVFQVEPEIVLLENIGLSSSELKKARKVIEENREIIIKNWKKFFIQKT